jgi:hypothetical protein
VAAAPTFWVRVPVKDHTEAACQRPGDEARPRAWIVALKGARAKDVMFLFVCWPFFACKIATYPVVYIVFEAGLPKPLSIPLLIVLFPIVYLYAISEMFIAVMAIVFYMGDA